MDRVRVATALAVCAAIFGFAAHPARCEDAAPAATAANTNSGTPPYQWVRTLESVQEQIGRGSRSAHDYLPVLVAKIADELDAVGPDQLLEPQNVRAILTYALSGGDSRVVRKLLGLGKLSEQDEKIAKGALAYLEGKYSVASEQLLNIDARSLSSELGARIALTQSILTYKSDLKRAIALLDLARLLSTGTLVEEAALRREAVLLAAAGEGDRFESLSGQYFRRYKDSIYSSYFHQQFCVAAASIDYAAQTERLERLAQIVEPLAEAQRLALYLTLAEKAIAVGNVPLTQFAGAEGEKLSKPETPERTRAALYLAAAEMVAKDSEGALTRLQSLPPASLSPSDENLRHAVLAVGEEIMRPPVEGEAGQMVPTSALDEPAAKKPESEKAVEGPAANGEKKADPPADPILDQVRIVLADADKILAKKKP